MLNLNEKQLELLKEDLSITADEISKMTIDEWREVRMKCFSIEGDEAMDIEKDTCRLSDRGEIAASIADTKYKQLFTKE